MTNKLPIKIFTGHYGSGKTEIAINFAIKYNEYYNNEEDGMSKVTIIDLDIVNPYFRSSSIKNELEEQGIKVIVSDFANTNIDLPALPPNIISVFKEKDLPAIFDVGGDDEGAKVLGRYSDYFKKNKYEMFVVINIKRPLTSSVDSCLTMINNIEKSSRLKVTGLINNTNTINLSNIEDLIEGQGLIEEVSLKTKIPIRYITGSKELLKKVPNNFIGEKLPLDLYLKLPWNNYD